ncbi:MAG: 16S rRNA (cytidine(1402)-2'-O)-methyltransferase [Alphaproteobacteria bacterium]|nr:16S rRNA (cytidine(1402)-2'-O)-methyltransferase [Alphaproteobacteria bacterium]
MDRAASNIDSNLPSGLYIIATPIGNMEDITLRALEILRKIDILACEDTRVTGKLTTVYDLPVRKIPYHDHNAEEMRPRLIAMLKEGKRVGLISDAGMPLISDPGYKLVEQCAAENIPMTCIPGATASITALVLSGLATDKFMFAGFLSSKTSARRTALSEIKSVPTTLIFYETSPRLTKSLDDMLAILGDRPAAVARELTKKFEEVKRGSLSKLVKHYKTHGNPKGEIVIVVSAACADQAEIWTKEKTDKLLLDMIDKHGMSVRDASAFIAAKSGIKKRDVYQRALILQQRKR